MGRLQQVFHSKYRKPLALFTLMLIVASVGAYQYGANQYNSQNTLWSEMEIHVTVDVVRDGVQIYWDHHAGTLTNVGKDFIEGKLSNDAFANTTDYAEYITLDTSSSSPVATWINLPTEINSNGLARAEGTYASTGVGVYTVSHEFTASGTHTDVQLTGLHWSGVDDDGSLFCADTFTPVTLETDDKITVTWTITAS